MTEAKAGDAGDPRRVLGELVRQLMAWQHVDKTDVARQAGIGRTTLYRLTVGDPNVTVETMGAVERALGQPFGLFRFVTDRNVSAIEAMPRLDADVKSWIIGALGVRPGTRSKREARRTA